MRHRPTALGWINYEITTSPNWDRARVRQLAHRLGYTLLWAPTDSVLDISDIIRAADVDAIITPTRVHLGATALDRATHLCDVEIVSPRTSFIRSAVVEVGI